MSIIKIKMKKKGTTIKYKNRYFKDKQEVVDKIIKYFEQYKKTLEE